MFMAWGVYHKAKIHGFSKGVFWAFGLLLLLPSLVACLLALLLQDVGWTVLQSEMFVWFLYGVAGFVFGCLLLMRNEKMHYKIILGPYMYLSLFVFPMKSFWDGGLHVICCLRYLYLSIGFLTT